MLMLSKYFSYYLCCLLPALKLYGTSIAVTLTRSVFHHYKISNFTVTHSQYGSSDCVTVKLEIL